MAERSTFPLTLLGALLLVLAWSLFAPHDYFTWFLEALPALLAVPVLFLTWRRFQFTRLAYTLMFVHAVILLVGAHYTYAEMPVFDWLRDALGLARNYYDRLGHVAQGFVPAILAREVLWRKSPLRDSRWLSPLALAVCMAISALYELFEWGVAEATGAASDAFLGTQGDPWDTQWDMFMCLLGAASALLLLRKWHDRQLSALARTQ